MSALTEAQIVAIHESGHAIAYAHFCYRHGGVRLFRDPDGEVVGSVTSPAGRYHPCDRALICLAGPLAEQRLTGIDWFDQPSSRQDVVMAKEALSRVGGALDRIVPFTRSLVEREWSAIMRIADALLRAGHLSWEQCIALYEESLSDGRSSAIAQ